VSLTPIFAGAAMLFAAAATVTLTDGAAWRLPAHVATLTNEKAVWAALRENCGVSDLARSDDRFARLNRAAEFCRLGDASAKPTVVLWGDSHAGAAAPALSEALLRAGKSGYLISRGGCPPIEGIGGIGGFALSCQDITDLALEAISSQGTDLVVILAARWAFYFEGTRYLNERGPDPFPLSGDIFAPIGSALDGTLARLQASGATLAIMTSVPEVAYDVPSAMGRAELLGIDVDFAPTRIEYEARQARANPELA